jgi:hypothetical protein
MRGWLVFLLATPAMAGCQTHLALRDDAVNMSTTLTDLNYQQTLNNVALFVHNPAALPSVVAFTTGTASVGDQKGYNGNANYAPTLTFNQQGGGALPILTLLFNPSVQRQVTENWTMVPITDTDHLRRLRCAFQLLVQDAPTTECDHCRARLEVYYLGEAANWECVIPRGWYQTGSKKDVPKNACFVGCYCDTYVWVMPDGLEGLTRFTMTVMDLASGKPHLPTKTIVKTFKADGKLDNTQETTTQIDREELDRIRQSMIPPDRPRKSPVQVNPGLYFAPK